MSRPELTYCTECGGVILRIDDATEEDGGWICTICGDDSRVDAEELFNDAVALERGTYRPSRDPRDELDGGWPQ